MIPTDQDRYNNSDGLLQDACQSLYELNEGLLVIPVMGDSSQKPVVIRLHPPYTMRRSEFTYSRAKVPPIVPAAGDTRGYGETDGYTNPGDTYLGGRMLLPAPGQTSEGDLLYKVAGGYNFLVANDVRMSGKIRFDARSYVSGVDFLGFLEEHPADKEKPWNSPFFDMNLLASSRILG